ncbi:MAG: HAD-IA family hydrolase [Clostridium beijerinckii]|jgi:putative hydrolase of the HAD superfamily|uniref:HAD family hydrolase n=1 Tax=Clostridium beijerinckii TaxID=1520 RepID=UPI0014949AD1|nr:HAD-IA family hydrolase [Clostridium beijerinckii]MCI1477726.1 HAD-IA family hydrolase [Clostridium beijerinckii]MCI1577958.1 HAD-IA family hydrolase [Clostridium beijerinckii]MCI1583139.1 HAD-IA family hydrolase [Clostridium beijerinckii]MCI1620631.1 HAD-IA family hydrolase [Clostridium beijerinckii]NOW87868.1 putative hydrolase of the HAD superfamily [Clostridium beijerinckii]
MIKALIFDLDDTLYYEKEYVLGSFKEVAYYLGNKYGKNEERLYCRMKEILKASGRGKIFNIICEENNFNEDIKNLIDIYRDSKPKLELYEDSKQVLDWARKQGYKLGIITDGCSKVQWNKIKALNLEKLVDKIIVTDDLGKEFWKPHQKSYINMMKYFCISKAECVYIGDNPNKDFIGAKKLGLKTIRIIRENGDHIKVLLNEEYEADNNIVSLLELRELLENNRLE